MSCPQCPVRDIEMLRELASRDEVSVPASVVACRNEGDVYRVNAMRRLQERGFCKWVEGSRSRYAITDDGRAALTLPNVERYEAGEYVVIGARIGEDAYRVWTLKHGVEVFEGEATTLKGAMDLGKRLGR
jgi:hypothetical protein